MALIDANYKFIMIDVGGYGKSSDGGLFTRPILGKLQEENMFNILKPTGYVMHQQFNIQQLYVLPTLYLCVLYLSENKLRLVPLTA